MNNLKIENCFTTKKEVYNYLLGKLVSNNEYFEVVINNEKWIKKYSFRLNLHVSDIFYNENTNEYCIHSNINNQKININFPNFGKYNNYEEMMEDLVNKYCKLLKVNF
jgi:hypothetical protein